MNIFCYAHSLDKSISKHSALGERCCQCDTQIIGGSSKKRMTKRLIGQGNEFPLKTISVEPNLVYSCLCSPLLTSIQREDDC